jgi:hypothetical protein
MFVLLKDWEGKLVDIFTGIEHISIHQLDGRCFTVSIIIFACPIFKKKHDPCYAYKSCNNEEKYEVHVNGYINSCEACDISPNQYFHKSYQSYF